MSLDYLYPLDMSKHDLCEDFDNLDKPSELPVYAGEDIDRYIENLNDWD